jgi:hypothetical protein
MAKTPAFSVLQARIPMLICTLCLLFAFVTAAAVEPKKDAKEPPPSETQRAKADFEKAKKALDDSYAKELKTIKKTYIAGLNAARKAALEKDDLDEAQRIALEVRELQK